MAVRLPILIVACFAVTFSAITLMSRAEAAPPSGLVVGVNCSKNPTWDADSCKTIGTALARIEFDISSPPTSLDTLIGAYASRGIQVQPLAGFEGRIPSASESANLRNWASRFGPGGSFWQNRSDGNLAIRNIEFGNETSYGYQYGDNWDSSSYTSRARDYAARASDAASALGGTNVGLLVQADDADTGSANWVKGMFAAVPNLDDVVTGWIVHPYGPGGYERLDRMISQLAAVGANSRIPFYITEWGVASDDGRTLSDNYGYPTNTTYSQAAQILRETVNTWGSRYGDRVAQLIVYQNADQHSSGASSDREGYFGIMRRDGTMKGAYATEVRSLLTNNTTTPTPTPAATPAPAPPVVSAPAPKPPAATPTPETPRTTVSGGAASAEKSPAGSNSSTPSRPSTYVVEWDGRLFHTAGDLRSHITGRGVTWSTFLSKHPAVAEHAALPFVVWNNTRFYDQSSLVKVLKAQKIVYRNWARNHPAAAPILAGRTRATTAARPARVLARTAVVTWAGIGFTTAGGLRTYLNQQRTDWNAFLSKHPKVAERFSLASVSFNGTRFYSRSALARWLTAHHTSLTTWSRNHPGAAAKLTS